MIPLLKMYDDVTSNKYVSLGITVASTAFIAYKTTFYLPTLVIGSPVFIISVCAGVAFALLTNTYIVHNEKVKTEGERNSIYATFSIITLLSPSKLNEIFNFVFYYNLLKIYDPQMIFFVDYIARGFELGFITTNLALQVLEGKTSCKGENQ